MHDFSPFSPRSADNNVYEFLVFLSNSSSLNSRKIQLAEGVILIHTKNTVFIDIGLSEKEFTPGWNVIGTIPEGLRPESVLNFLLCDNSASSSTDTAILFGRIAVSTGAISVYVFADKATVYPTGYVMYML